jgi:hypothetical protein
MNKTVGFAIGLGIGLLLLALSARAFAAYAHWGGLGRDGAEFGYFLVAFFLLVAGLGCIAASWNHSFRVLAPGRPRAGGHP